MTLKGTIVDGQQAIAIIGDQFVRVGDQIGEFQVENIAEDAVLLGSSDQKIVLVVLDHARKTISAIYQDKDITDTETNSEDKR
jgi:hypothetical protein